jgi:hypothetical protein
VDSPAVSAAAARTVAIVLDPAFSARLASLAERAAVWIIDSSENRPAIEAIWNARRREHATYDVTVFREIPELSMEDHLAGVLRSIELDTDPDDERPPLEWVEVYGVESTDAVGSVLRSRGFGGTAPLPDGFRARVRGDR